MAKHGYKILLTEKELKALHALAERFADGNLVDLADWDKRFPSGAVGLFLPERRAATFRKVVEDDPALFLSDSPSRSLNAKMWKLYERIP